MPFVRGKFDDFGMVFGVDDVAASDLSLMASASWHWRNGVADETLEIEAGTDLVTVIGRGLERLVDALERNSLEILNETPDSKSGMADDPIQIYSINVS